MMKKFSKIDEDTVKLIHAIKRIKKVKNQTIGNIFGIKKSTVGGILKRRSWMHVEPPTPEEAMELVVAFDTLEDPEREYIEYRKVPLMIGNKTMKDFIKSKKSKVTRWLMKPFSDNQGINNFRYSIGVKK